MSQSLLLNLDDFVRITNNSDEVVWGRYDGRDYEWQPKDFLDVHKVVATHVFGYIPPEAQLTQERMEDIRVRAFMRLGWLGSADQSLKTALAKLRTIAIEPVPPFPNVRVLRREDPHQPPQIEMVDPELPAPRVAPGPAGEAAPEEKSSGASQTATLSLPKKGVK